MARERSVLKPGMSGINNSLIKISEYIREGMLDEEIRAYGIRACKDAGLGPYAKPIERARAILFAVRRDFLWVPDPRNTEFIASAKKTLKVFLGGDCDDLTVLLASIFLACASCFDVACHPVGIVPVSVVVNGFDKSSLGHVLVAIWDQDGKEWLYADPSDDKSDFGKHAVAPHREVMIDPMTGRVFCDVNNKQTCAKKPPPQDGEGTFIALSGLPGEPVDQPRMLGDLPVPGDSSSAWAEYFLYCARELQGSWDDTLAAYNNMIAIYSSFNENPMADGKATTNMSQVTTWNSGFQQWMVDAQAATKFAVQALTEAGTGERKVYLTPGEWGVESKPTDPFRIEKTASGAFSLVKDPNVVTGLGGNTLGIAPLLVAVIVIGSVLQTAAIASVAYFALKSVVDLLRIVTERASEYLLHRKYVECSEKNGFPACKELFETVTEGHKKIIDSETRRQATNNEDPLNQNPVAQVFMWVAVIGGIGLLGYGAFKWSQMPSKKGGKDREKEDRTEARTERAASQMPSEKGGKDREKEDRAEARTERAAQTTKVSRVDTQRTLG